MTTSRSPRHSATAALTLAAAFTLAACGGDDGASIAPPPAPAPTEESTPSEPAEPETSQETEEPTSEWAEETEEPTSEDTAPEPSSDADDSGATAAGELPQVDITWPGDWVDLTASLEATVPPGHGMEAAGLPNPDGFTTNGVVVTYPAGTVPDGGTYDELLRNGQGVDPSTLGELPDEEIDGHTATAYRSDASEQGITYRQHLYGIVLEDGSVVEIVFSAGIESFSEDAELFQEALGTVVIGR